MSINLDAIEGPVMLLQSGRYFDIVNPDPNLIDIEDIAHSLSMQCRYTGHCRDFYSVAEHSVLCSYLVPKPFKLEALLHDAAETYISDVASPFKGLIAKIYKPIETRIELAIAKRFELEYPWALEVKEADLRMLAIERQQLMPPAGRWECLKGVAPAPLNPMCWTPEVAKERFLARFHGLTALRGVDALSK